MERPFYPACGVMFHHFHDSSHYRTQGSISAEDLDGIIEYLGRDTILPAREWMDLALNHSLSPDQFCLTFDDNLRCQFDIALPVLQSHGLTAFFFINTGPLDGDLEFTELFQKFRSTCYPDIDAFYQHFFQTIATTSFADQAKPVLDDFSHNDYLAEFGFYTEDDRKFRYIRDLILGPDHYRQIMLQLMKKKGLDIKTFSEKIWMTPCQLDTLCRDGHILGLHSHSHPTKLNQMSYDAQNRDYRTNLERLTAITGEPIHSVSHPCNNYNADTLRILTSLGIKLGFLARMTDTQSSLLEVPRLDHCHLIKQLPRK